MSSYIGAILSLLTAFQLFFVAIFLFFYKQGNKRNNRILGLIFLMFAISMADVTIRVLGIEIPIPALHLLDDGFLFLYGPLLYFYTKGVVYSDFRFKVKHLFHLIPYMLFLAYLILSIFSLSQVDQVEATNQILSADLPVWMFVASIPLYLYLFSYLWFCRQTINTYSAAIKDKFSFIDGINLNWLTFIIHSFTVITIIAMVNSVVPIFGSVFFHYASLVSLLIFTFFFINRVLVKALNQPKVFSGITLDEREKYAGSNLAPDQIQNYKLQLVELLKNEKVYLKVDLTLIDLANHLQITTKVLSQVINQGFNQNFYDLINSYRCEHVKNILNGADAKMTVLEAMYNSGFSSKSSFNKEFKKLTGQTPSEYKNQQTK